MRHTLSYRDRLRSSNTVAAAVSVAEGASGIVWLAAEAPQNQTGKFLRDRKVIPWWHWKFESGSQEIRNYCPLTCVLLGGGLGEGGCPLLNPPFCGIVFDV